MYTPLFQTFPIKISLICLLMGTFWGIETLNATESGEITEFVYRPIINLSIKKIFTQDDRIDTFVSKTTPLRDKQYIPSDLVPVGGIPEIDEAGRLSKLRLPARKSLWQMARAFQKEFKKPLVVISAYRSADYQQKMWDRGSCTITLCAPPGHSEHQLGLAVDFFDASTAEEYYKNPKYVAYVQWLRDNAHTYGWTESYQKGEEIDEYEKEPWHWRYVGVELATKLKNLGMTYTEYQRFGWIVGRK